LLEAAVMGKIPLWVAVDIAKTDTPEMQRELLKAYEEKQLDYKSLKYVKGLIESRRRNGKQRGGRSSAVKPKTSIESFVMPAERWLCSRPNASRSWTWSRRVFRHRQPSPIF
jgi:ParB family chromosome partitioning protein